MHWIDNADSYICPVCGFETDNPNRYDDAKCPSCGFQDIKDKVSKMRKFVALDEMWDCGTCFHHRSGKCDPMTWCESGESYRPDFSKMTVYTFDENDVKMKTRGREGSADYEVLV